jgi:probable HAF family extracellular repeat protein
LYDGISKDIGALGGTESVGRGINASGQVTGYLKMSTSASQQAFFYDGATMHNIGSVDESSEGRDNGQIVGILGGSLLNSNAGIAFFYDGTIHETTWL